MVLMVLAKIHNMKHPHYWYVPGLTKKHRKVFLWEVVREVAEWENVSVGKVKCGGGRKMARLRYIVCYLYGKHGMGLESNKGQNNRSKEIVDFFGYKVVDSVRIGGKWVRDRMAWDGEVRDCVEWVEMRLIGWDKKELRRKN
jgi:hypothetical protein